MIRAEHKIWAGILFDPYVTHILKKSFSNFYLINDLPEIPEDKSLIITPNHISWWDGFFIYFTAKTLLDRKIHLMMLESSLNKYWFFKKVGAFSINPLSPKSILETFNYSREILDDFQNYIVTYPQGEIEPFEKKPLTIRAGIKTMINPLKKNVVIMPIGFKIQPYEKRNPSIICRFGSLINGEDLVADFLKYEKEFNKNLDLLSIASFDHKFEKDMFQWK